MSCGIRRQCSVEKSQRTRPICSLLLKMMTVHKREGGTYQIRTFGGAEVGLKVAPTYVHNNSGQPATNCVESRLRTYSAKLTPLEPTNLKITSALLAVKDHCTANRSNHPKDKPKQSQLSSKCLNSHYRRFSKASRDWKVLECVLYQKYLQRLVKNGLMN